MLNVPVAEIGLECPGIVPSVGKCVAARMPEHVRVRLKPQFGANASALDHASETGCREGEGGDFYSQIW